MHVKLLSLAAAVILVGSYQNSPQWNVQIDSRTNSDWIAEGPGRVFALQGGRLVSIDAVTGRILWKSNLSASSGPAYASGGLAVPTDDGLAFIDVTNGKTRRSVHLAQEVRVASSATLIVALIPETPKEQWAPYPKYVPANGYLRGYDGAGMVRWSRRILVETSTQLLSLGGNVIAVSTPRGQLILDASDGKPVAFAEAADQLIGSDGRYLWFTVIGGGIKGIDLDSSRSIALHGAVIRGAVSVEHGIAVAVVNGRLQMMDIARGGSPKTLHVYGRWIGGPVGGKIFVERSDGLYLQSLSSGHADLVTPYRSSAALVTSDRGIGFVGLRDGSVLIVNVAQGALIDTLHTDCHFYEGFSASGNTSIVHCDGDRGVQLIGFARAF